MLKGPTNRYERIKERGLERLILRKKDTLIGKRECVYERGCVRHMSERKEIDRGR